jgi:diaminohydroxyphosphoribosylaminopyrimidine deaminase/5-amino-6-(5-phosphoribosylamino)uracil reductase
MKQSEFYLSLALKEAWKYQVLTFPNPPVGAVVVIDGVLYSIGVHKKAGSFHAEINAIVDAYYKITKDKRVLQIEDANQIHEYLCKNHNGIFKNATILVTLEPCNHYGKTPPCAVLIQKLLFKKVIIGSFDSPKSSKNGLLFLKESNIDVETGLLKKQCDMLVRPFEIMRKRAFVFFKFAQTLNGGIKGGYLSCDESLNLVHAIRDKIDLLVIGGESVRTDRPTLDARRIDGKAPDILIYSQSKDFDKSIPLFGVPNRSVYIEDSLDKIKEYRSVMIEGGNGMLNSTKDIIDYILIFNTPVFSNSSDISIDLDIEFLSVDTISRDSIMWCNIKR